MFAGADPEDVEPGGANSINCQTEPGGGAQIYFLVLHIRVNRGRAPGDLYGKSAPGYKIYNFLSKCVIGVYPVSDLMQPI